MTAQWTTSGLNFPERRLGAASGRGQRWRPRIQMDFDGKAVLDKCAGLNIDDWQCVNGYPPRTQNRKAGSTEDSLLLWESEADQKRRLWNQNQCYEFSFGKACDHLSQEPMVNAFNTHLRRLGGQSLFDAKDKKAGRDGGYARQWYTALCGYAHSRPGLTDGDLRESNGPIYVAKAFRDWYCAYLRTVSICSVLILLCRPGDDRGQAMKLFTDDDTIVPADVRQAFAISSAPKTAGPWVNNLER
jgi:hypothetical protein